MFARSDGRVAVGSPMGCKLVVVGVAEPSAKYPVKVSPLRKTRLQTGRVVLSPLLWLTPELWGRPFSTRRRLNCMLFDDPDARTAITMREPGSSVSRNVAPPCDQPSPLSVGPLTRRGLTSTARAMGLA